MTDFKVLIGIVSASLVVVCVILYGFMYYIDRGATPAFRPIPLPIASSDS
jgi:hypothetical protein